MVKRIETLEDVNAHLRELVGLPCWRVGWLDSHPSSLQLGARIPVTHANARSEFTLHLWFVEVLVAVSPDEPRCAAELDEEAVERALLDDVVAVEATQSGDIVVDLARGGRLVAMPNQPDEYEYWELFDRDGMVLNAMWGPTWRYVRSDSALPEPPEGWQRRNVPNVTE